MSNINRSFHNPSLLRDARILVADNDADSLYMYTVLFESCGAQVKTAASISDAIDLLDCFTPDILVCEIQFANETVLPLLQRMKALAGRDRVIPILAVSAYCSARSAQNLLEFFKFYLLKPTDVEFLVDEVWKLICLSKATNQLNIQDWVAKQKTWTKLLVAEVA